MRNSALQAIDHYVRQTRPKVFLAEDDEDLRTLIALALEADGYEVIEAANGIQLHDMIREQLLVSGSERPPALIISDIVMPGETGLDVLADVRAAEKPVPFILITALKDKDKHDLAAKLGASAVFQKPFEVHDLRMAVLNLLPPLPPTSEYPAAPRDCAEGPPAK